MPTYEQIKSEIEKIVACSYGTTDLAHAQGVLDWVLKMKPDADDAMKIAAFGHDIERGVLMEKRPNSKDYPSYEEYKIWHATRCAQIMEETLNKLGCEKDFVARVKYLVQNHEVGGDSETDVIKDADSISFLIDNLDYYLLHKGVKDTRAKVEYMYNRMTDAGKKIAKELYDKVLIKLSV